MEIKFLTDRVKKEIEKRSANHREAIAWNSAAFGKSLMFYQNTVHHPEDYVDGASKSMAESTMRYFKKLLELDRDAATTLYESFMHELWDMIRRDLDEDPFKYLQFYYNKTEP